jgi:hypothetical protein
VNNLSINNIANINFNDYTNKNNINLNTNDLINVKNKILIDNNQYNPRESGVSVQSCDDYLHAIKSLSKNNDNNINKYNNYNDNKREKIQEINEEFELGKITSENISQSHQLYFDQNLNSSKSSSISENSCNDTFIRNQVNITRYNDQEFENFSKTQKELRKFSRNKEFSEDGNRDGEDKNKNNLEIDNRKERKDIYKRKLSKEYRETKMDQTLKIEKGKLKYELNRKLKQEKNNFPVNIENENENQGYVSEKEEEIYEKSDYMKESNSEKFDGRISYVPNFKDIVKDLDSGYIVLENEIMNNDEINEEDEYLYNEINSNSRKNNENYNDDYNDYNDENENEEIDNFEDSNKIFNPLINKKEKLDFTKNIRKSNIKFTQLSNKKSK